METAAEHINIQVEELLTNEVIQWNSIIDAMKNVQKISIPLSESLYNLISQLKIHYQNDINLAKSIYKDKAQQYELMTAKTQLNEIKLNNMELEKEEEEEDDNEFGNMIQNEIILEETKTTQTFNFPLVNETDSGFSEFEPKNTSICSCNSFEIPNPKYVNASTQEAYFDCKRINSLIYENNQYLKIAKSWKMQCEASNLKIEEMKRRNKIDNNYD